MFIQKKRGSRRVMAETDVAPEAAELLFQAEDVAELVAEVTGEVVEVEADDQGESVTFNVGDDAFTVEAEGDEEAVESCTRPARSKRPVAASTRRGSVSGARNGRVVRKAPRRQ